MSLTWMYPLCVSRALCIGVTCFVRVPTISPEGSPRTSASENTVAAAAIPSIEFLLGIFQLEEKNNFTVVMESVACEGGSRWSIIHTFSRLFWSLSNDKSKRTTDERRQPSREPGPVERGEKQIGYADSSCLCNRPSNNIEIGKVTGGRGSSGSLESFQFYGPRGTGPRGYHAEVSVPASVATRGLMAVRY